MPIKISSVDLLTRQNMDDIVNYYNNYITKEDPPIEYFEYIPNSWEKHVIRGFRIQSANPNFMYREGAYRYMRWQHRTLTAIYNYLPFSSAEETRLFRTMGFVLGKEHVSFYETYNQAVKHSPSFHRTVFSDLFQGSPRRIPPELSPGTSQTSGIFNHEKKICVTDTSELSLSANAGWKFPRIRI